MLNNWNCVIITCPTTVSCLSTEKEISYLKRKGRISNSLCVLTVEDPAKNIGSGAATLNALLIATEHLSVKQNYMVVSSDVLNEARILILHNGRNYIYSRSEKAFINLPLEYVSENSSHYSCASGIVSNLESTLMLVDELSHNCLPGVWVCSTDMMILKGQQSITIDWQNIADVVMFCVPANVKYATGHGVVATDEQGHISDIHYCGHETQIKDLAQTDGKVPLISGIVYLTVRVAESLLSLHVQAPLDSCTYLGLDSGADPIQVSLFFDLLVAMSSGITKESFIAGKCGKTYNLKAGISKGFANESILARSLVWDELSKYRMSSKILSGCSHLYWSANDSARNHMDNLTHIANSGRVHSLLEVHNSFIGNHGLLVNSYFKVSESCEISPNSIVYDSIFETKSLHVGCNSFICGVSINNSSCNLTIPSDLVVIQTFIKNSGKEIILMFGVNENLMDPVDINFGKFCNRPWKEQLEFLNLSEVDVWPDSLDSKLKTLMNAKLFVSNPFGIEFALKLYQSNRADTLSSHTLQKFHGSTRYSISDVLNATNYGEVLTSRRSRYAKIALDIIKKVLMTNEDIPLLPYFHAACAEEWHVDVMNTIDDVLLSDTNSVIKTRALSNMADLLGAMAGSEGGLRTGPGSNPAWSEAFQSLMKGETVKGLQMLQAERAKWLDRPDHIMRAARHYERAAQIFIQRSVRTVKESFNLSSVPLPEIGSFVIATCPARIDIQGGWSDTPPICYELGGSVVNIALLIDGKKPIGAKASRIQEPCITLKLGQDMCSKIMIRDMKDILNYDQPNAQGALLKAAIVCANIVDIHSLVPLSEQLLSRYGGGFLIQSWSLLPHGCGMGASSILAAAVLGALWSVSGHAFDKSTLIHAVLYVEQLLTTGGGWQDQVAGVIGGVNRGYSEATLPLSIKAETVAISPETAKKLNSHLLLIYTGKVRLAKNLLQNVIRNWYAREETVVSCFKNLILHSHQMKEALEKGDLFKVGDLMNKYWEQKKILAPGCEPLIVKTLMETLKPVCYGQLLAGAGGGGFMCILTKEPNARDSVQHILLSIMGNEKMSLHSASVDFSGLEISHDNNSIE